MEVTPGRCRRALTADTASLSGRSPALSWPCGDLVS